MKNTNNPLHDLPHYIKIFQNYLGRSMYYIFALTLISGLIEGVGILMLLPLLTSLTPEGVTSQPVDGVSLFLYDMLSAFNIQESTNAIILIIGLSFFAKGFITFGSLSYIAYLRRQLQIKLKSSLFDYYGKMSLSYYSSRDTGYFINIINEQVTRALQSFYLLAQTSTQVISTIVYIFLAFTVAWRFGLMALFFGLVLAIIFRRLNNYVRRLSRNSAIESGSLSKLLIQTLHAFKYLAATDQSKVIRTPIITSIEKLSDYQMRTGISAGFTQSVREPIAVTLIMFIAYIQLVYFQQSLAPILVSILLFYRGINSILSAQSSWQNTLEAIGSMELVHKEFSTLEKNQEIDKGVYKISTFDKSINFYNVYFKYNSNNVNTIKGLNLKIPVRTSIALVGESGSGKSTIADIITLMHKPQHGRITIDDMPVEDIQLSSWREKIGYVSQESVILNDSIENNICMLQKVCQNDIGIIDRIKKAASQANLVSVIENLPQGYQTLVGDRGLKLSGGQRQRLFIARELYRNPSLLILDEATSALDSKSEAAIQKSIDDLRGQITLIIIAHRISTIQNVDCIYVIEDGRVVEDGNFKDLSSKNGSRFMKFVEMQSI
jgi:ABC-type multidrug transport system fused ATPase/permease subunit